MLNHIMIFGIKYCPRSSWIGYNIWWSTGK